jgi:hypothetical protein
MKRLDEGEAMLEQGKVYAVTTELTFTGRFLRIEKRNVGHSNEHEVAVFSTDDGGWSTGNGPLRVLPLADISTRPVDHS